MGAMEATEGEGSDPPRYALDLTRLCGEDILFCVDVDAESLVEMKATGSNGRPLTRLDSIKQAILLFVHSKLSINPDHRFAFATLSKSASWVLSISLLSPTSPTQSFCPFFFFNLSQLKVAFIAECSAITSVTLLSNFQIDN